VNAIPHSFFSDMSPTVVLFILASVMTLKMPLDNLINILDTSPILLGSIRYGTSSSHGIYIVLDHGYDSESLFLISKIVCDRSLRSWLPTSHWQRGWEDWLCNWCPEVLA
jgi:hypothetical protein